MLSLNPSLLKVMTPTSAESADVADNIDATLQSRCDYLSILSLLIVFGADVNAEDDVGRTPLMISVERDDLSAIRLFVAAGAILDYSGRSGTALHHAASRSKPETIRLLLELGASVDSKDALNNTPLHKATRHGKLDAIDLFLKNGADPDSLNHEGMTPLDTAAFSGSIEVFEFFVERGIDLCPSESKGLKLLSIAVECKHDPLALWLLSNEADLNSNYSSSRQTIYRFLPASISLCISMCFCACLPIFLY